LVLGIVVTRFLIRVSDNLKETRASAVVPKGLPEALERHVDTLAGNPEHDGAIRKRNYRDVNALVQAQHYVQGEFKTLEDGVRVKLNGVSCGLLPLRSKQQSISFSRESQPLLPFFLVSITRITGRIGNSAFPRS